MCGDMTWSIRTGTEYSPRSARTPVEFSGPPLLNLRRWGFTSSAPFPQYLHSTYADVNLSSTTLRANFTGPTAGESFASENDFSILASGYNIYVAANVPSLPSACFQLKSSNGWSALNLPVKQFRSDVALVRAQMLQNTNRSSPQLAGTSILVGYWTDPNDADKRALPQDIHGSGAVEDCRNRTRSRRIRLLLADCGRLDREMVVSRPPKSGSMCKNSFICSMSL